jgi:hypothetical protein
MERVVPCLFRLKVLFLATEPREQLFPVDVCEVLFSAMESSAMFFVLSWMYGSLLVLHNPREQLLPTTVLKNCSLYILGVLHPAIFRTKGSGVNCYYLVVLFPAIEPGISCSLLCSRSIVSWCIIQEDLFHALVWGFPSY